MDLRMRSLEEMAIVVVRTGVGRIESCLERFLRGRLMGAGVRVRIISLCALGVFGFGRWVFLGPGVWDDGRGRDAGV